MYVHWLEIPYSLIVLCLSECAARLRRLESVLRDTGRRSRDIVARTSAKKDTYFRYVDDMMYKELEFVEFYLFLNV